MTKKSYFQSKTKYKHQFSFELILYSIWVDWNDTLYPNFIKSDNYRYTYLYKEAQNGSIYSYQRALIFAAAFQ